jgi:hypothetical protein
MNGVVILWLSHVKTQIGNLQQKLIYHRQTHWASSYIVGQYVYHMEWIVLILIGDILSGS